MLTYRFTLSAIFQICLLFSGTVALTQERPGQWVGDLYLRTCWTSEFKDSSILIDENQKIHTVISDLIFEKNFSRIRRK
jgi:hypothetical protein